MDSVITRSLYQRIGGADTIDTAVHRFYQKILADPDLQGFFIGVDMERLHHQQKRFLGYVFSGPIGYNGRSMRETHRRLVEEQGLNDEHFDAAMAHLADALEALDIPEDLIQEAAVILESVRDDVLNR